MPYEAECGDITIALAGDIMPSRKLAVYHEPQFLSLRELLQSASEDHEGDLFQAKE